MGQDDGYVYGLVPKTVAAAMTGRELLQAVVDARLPQPPIARTLSIRLVEGGDGFAAFEGDPGPHLLNAWGTVHGGWALTLIDSAGLCRPDDSAGGRGLHDDRDQGQLQPSDHDRHRSTAR